MMTTWSCRSQWEQGVALKHEACTPSYIVSVPFITNCSWTSLRFECLGDNNLKKKINFL